MLLFIQMWIILMLTFILVILFNFIIDSASDFVPCHFIFSLAFIQYHIPSFLIFLYHLKELESINNITNTESTSTLERSCVISLVNYIYHSYRFASGKYWKTCFMLQLLILPVSFHQSNLLSLLKIITTTQKAIKAFLFLLFVFLFSY